MYKVYKENNCLDLYLKYYGNYFGADFIVEEGGSTIISSKLFLFAYTLEEDNGKSFYSLMNNDLRSGDSEKICRYLPSIRAIYDLVRTDYLKSYAGEVFRATYFKKELIDEIKPGEKVLIHLCGLLQRNLVLSKIFYLIIKKIFYFIQQSKKEIILIFT